MNNIVEIKTPLLLNYEKMERLGDSIKQRLEPYSSGKIVVNEENRKDIKKLRADLNKEFNEAEDIRKKIRREVEDPYKKFLASYKENVEIPYREAIDSLDKEVKVIEDGIKDEKRKEVVKYAEELLEHHSIDFINFNDLSISVNLSSSVNKLKEEVETKIKAIVSDVEMINALDHGERILVEYKRTLNSASSIKTVMDSIEQEELLKKKKAELEAKGKEEKQKEEVVFEEPVVEKPKDEKLYVMNFSVKGTIDELKEIKNFLEKGGYSYE